ncbi:hypothetical protein UFOVP1204_5 [uncultured Caudovirales phage]|uniref:Uncharacterized protein n=1 Tax=uncultured Caudovirales phage TaxID=2100421 RepID=A0A6J5MHI0_9CAUD|nr:hypothetical protein UFOVP473_22 [uncultured Caudovirales phage]CAB4176393.1 hypothetical protein UFOVP983_22 [uncultured Caudovirales phage]CAB4189475.1 hypothetical protein UFOVP1204_5 [uncultured Caudovirales phage]
MRIEERIIRAIRDQKSELAESSLARPQERDAFEFGRVSGMYVGLSRALQIIENILNEDKEEDHGKSRRGD